MKETWHERGRRERLWMFGAPLSSRAGNAICNLLDLHPNRPEHLRKVHPREVAKFTITQVINCQAGVGKTTVAEIEQWLSQHGLAFAFDARRKAREERERALYEKLKAKYG